MLAGKEIMQVYESADFGVEIKSDNSPLTLADKRANAVITDILSKSFPQYAILSEEKADDLSRLNEDFCFIVDPLDGTKEFIKRNGEFTVNIALSYLGKSIMGVIYVPVSGDVYYSCDQKGSFLQSNVSDMEQIEFFDAQYKIKVSDKKDNLTVMASRSHSDEKTAKMLEDNKDKIGTTVSAGSSLKGCYIACGKSDIYYRFGLTSEWDTAAMQNIVENAGGIFMQTDDTPMRYNRSDILNRKGFYILNNPDNKFMI
ncbi:MAG: 3'(2'),5'-bisphosphate nucleotidase CysQ [Ruminococcaceae bacterium]|nr:3'(2'),5'-bisphosphate nucleotidase CysQ [Oscillospiraceae bacterium]